MERHAQELLLAEIDEMLARQARGASALTRLEVVDLLLDLRITMSEISEIDWNAFEPSPRRRRFLERHRSRIRESVVAQ